MVIEHLIVELSTYGAEAISEPMGPGLKGCIYFASEAGIQMGAVVFAWNYFNFRRIHLRVVSFNMFMRLGSGTLGLGLGSSRSSANVRVLR